jgi:hypothetical protein
MTLRLASDFDVNGVLLRGLRRRMPAIDLLRAQDFLPEGTPDPTVLAWSASLGRVLISNDRRTMSAYAGERIAAGESMPGLIMTTKRQPIAAAINDIEIIVECMSADEIENAIVFLPF